MTPLQWLLRIVGTVSLLALLFVAAPHAWMLDIHRDIGLGDMPDTPVVWYLARSTSAFYAILGGLLWVVSVDPARHRLVLLYLGWAILIFGLSLLVIDYLEGLPFWWWVWEGPFVALFGVAILALTPRKEQAHGN